MKVNKLKKYGWVWYFGNELPEFDTHKCGKWMYFFDDRDFIEKICDEAIKQEAIKLCKHSDEENGVTCFYLEDDDIEAHKKILKFFLDNKLIKKTKTGRLYNIGFKYDDQTEAGEYGDNFKALIKLDKFVDLNTGKFII